MFKFLHAADTHIDSPLRGLDAYEGAPVEALRHATRTAFQNLIDVAIGEEVDFVLLAGDIYDGDWKDYGTGLFFVRQMARLQAAGIPVYMIAGNHDAESAISRKLSLPDNVHNYSTRKAETREHELLPVAIHGKGFPNKAVPENLVPAYPDPIPGKFNIGLLHTSLTGNPQHDTYAPCSVNDLVQKDYQYWALGHIHQPQVVHKNPWIVFPGNTQGRHAREVGARGCRLVEVDDNLEVIACDFVRLDVVCWAEVRCDVSVLSARDAVVDLIGDALRSAYEETGERMMAVRVVLGGATAMHGELHQESEWLRAECIARALAVAGEQVWIEDIRVETTPTYDLAELAERDELTRALLETLENAEAGALEVPDEVDAMLRILPGEIAGDIRSLLEPGQREQLTEAVRTLLIDALQRYGGEA